MLVPRIRVRADDYGVRVAARTLPQVGRTEWVKVADHLANAWGCVRVAVTQPEPGRLSIRAVRRDPLIEPFSHVPSGLAPADLERWDIGRDEYADPVGVQVSNVPGVSIAGLPGYGKTSLINRLVASLAPSPAVQLAVVDGKGGADYEDLAPRFFAMCGDDLREANRLFQRVNEVRRRRSQLIRTVLGVKNMWHVGPSARLAAGGAGDRRGPHVLRGGQGRQGTDGPGGREPAPGRGTGEEGSHRSASSPCWRPRRAPVTRSRRRFGTCVRWRSSFAQRTDEAAVAALGADIRQYPDANPVALQDPAYVGVASMVVQGRPGFVRVRTPHVSDEDVVRVCAATSDLVRDPGDLLDEAARTRPVLPSPAAAPARGEDRSGGAAAGEHGRARVVLAGLHASLERVAAERVEDDADVA